MTLRTRLRATSDPDRSVPVDPATPGTFAAPGHSVDARRASTESFETLFDASAEGIVITEDGVVVAVNQKWLDMTGRERADVVGRHGLEFADPASRPVAGAAIRTGSEACYEAELLHRDGSSVPVEVLGRRITYLGRPMRLTTLRDISGRRRAEAALRASEARFRALVQETGELIVILGPMGGTRYANPALERMLGLSLVSDLDRLRTDLLHPDDAARTIHALDVVFAEPGRRERVEFRLRHADGSWVVLDAVLTNLLDDRNVGGVVVNARDVTERVAAEGRYRDLFHRTPVMHVVSRHEADGPVVAECNELFASSLGYATDEVVGRPVADFYASDSRAVLLEGGGYRRAQIPGVLAGERRLLARDGRVLETILSLRTEADGDGRVVGASAAYVDVTARNAAERDLRDREEQLRLAVDAARICAWEWRPGTDELLVLGDVEIGGGRSADWQRCRYDDFVARVHPDDRARLLAADAALVEGATTDGEYRVVAADGSVRWIHDRGQAVSRGGELLVVGITVDITEARDTAERLMHQAKMLDQAQAAIVGTDPGGVVTHWNRHAERLFGWAPGEAIGRTVVDLVGLGASAGSGHDAIGRIRGGAASEGEYLARRRDGSTVPIQSSASPVRDEAGEVVGIVGVSVDLTERKALEARLAQLAYYDALTGLPNRARFLERLEGSLGRSGVGSPAVLFLDLDGFKVVNDSLGHDAGDRLLEQFSRRLAACVRPADTIARFGGDEFAVLLEDADERTVALVAERILSAVRAPFDLGGREAYVGASIGAAIAAGADQGALDVLRDADVALYEAKGRGRGRCATFDAAAGARAARRMELETDLRLAVERGELELMYQPVVDFVGRRVHGFEALLRWRHPRLGLLGPGEFVGLAEETGLIAPIGVWVLEEACRRGAAWAALRPADPPVMAVNVSPRQFRDPALGHALWRALGETGFPPERLKLEVTEAALAEDERGAADFLRAIKGVGVQIALDDFGTGYSSLGRLHLLPLDEIKIDRSFVADLERSRQAPAIVRAITAMAHELGLAVTAEGIEREGQWDAVGGLGVDRVQGYLIARPLPAAEATAFLSGATSARTA